MLPLPFPGRNSSMHVFFINEKLIKALLFQTIKTHYILPAFVSLNVLSVLFNDATHYFFSQETLRVRRVSHWPPIYCYSGRTVIVPRVYVMF